MRENLDEFVVPNSDGATDFEIAECMQKIQLLSQ